MIKYHDFNTETPEEALRRRQLATILQQVEMLTNEQYRMPETPSSESLMSPEIMRMIMSKKGAGKAEKPQLVGDFPPGLSMPTYG